MPDDPKPAGETPAQTTTTPSPPDAAKLADEVSSLKSFVEELKAESIQNRHKAKAATTVLDNLRTALGIEGDPATIEVKVKEAVAQKDATIKQILLEREVERAAVKAGLRKPELAGRLLDLADIDVDPQARTVKGNLDAKFEELKKSVPELFGAMPQPAPAPRPPAGTQDPGSPSAGALGSILEEWEAAKATGDRAAMNRLMTDPVKGKAIGAHIDSMRPRH